MENIPETTSTPPAQDATSTGHPNTGNPVPPDPTPSASKGAATSCAMRGMEKIRSFWNSGVKGKAICIAILAVLVYLIWPGGDGAKALLAKAEKRTKAEGNVNFCGFYTGMPKADADALAAHYGLKEGEYEFFENPETHELYAFTFESVGVYRLTGGGLSFADQLREVSSRVGTMQYDEDLEAYIFKPIGGKLLVGLSEKRLGIRDAPRAKAAEEAAARVESQRARIAAQRGAAAWAELGEGKKAGATKTLKLPGGAKMEFVWCPPGTFTMGSRDEEVNANPMHEVALTKGFWMAKTEVTQKQWKSVMGTSLRTQWKKHDADGEENLRGEGPDFPMYFVTWKEADEFCQKAGMSLPTEAQWEYACRAGSAGPYGGTGNLEEMGWAMEGPDGQTHPVGKKSPNAWGLLDMHGNVAEYCSDRYGDYPTWTVVDPTGPGKGQGLNLIGECFVERGGSWDSDAPGVARWTSTSSARGIAFSDDYANNETGFRPVVCRPQ